MENTKEEVCYIKTANVTKANSIKGNTMAMAKWSIEMAIYTVGNGFMDFNKVKANINLSTDPYIEETSKGSNQMGKGCIYGTTPYTTAVG